MTLDPELTSKEMVMFNLARSLDRNADRTPHEDAVIFRGTRLTHLQLLDRVSALAAAAGSTVSRPVTSPSTPKPGSWARWGRRTRPSR